MSATKRAGGAATAIVPALAALAGITRLPVLLGDGVWRDQANVYVQVASPSFREFFDRMTSTEWHPPLYFLLAYGWARALGTAELTFTVLPWIFSILTVPAVYSLGKWAHSRSAGYAAAALFTLNPAAAMLSTQYVYPLATLLFTTLAAVVTRARREECSSSQLVCLAILAALTVYTHYLALAYVGLLIVWVCFSPKRQSHNLKVALSLAVGLVSFLPWLPIFAAQRGIGVPYSVGVPLHQRIEYAVNVLLQFTFVPPLPIAIAIPLLVIFAVIVHRAKVVRSDAASLGGIAFAMLALTTLANLLEIRYVIPVYGLFAVFVAATGVNVASMHRSDWYVSSTRRAAIVTVAALALLAIVNVVQVIRVMQVPSSGIRTMAVGGHLNRQALYILAPDYLAATFAFYARDEDIAYTGFVRSANPQVFRLRNYARDWNDPRSITKALQAIDAAPFRYRYLDVVVDKYATTEGHVPYSRVWALVQALKNRYHLLAMTTYAGRNEMVNEYRFSLHGRTGRERTTAAIVP